MVNDDQVPRAGLPLLSEEEQMDWISGKSEYTNKKAAQLLNINMEQVYDILTNVRFTLRFETKVTALEDGKGKEDNRPYVKAGQKMKGWMMNFSTANGKAQAFSHLIPRMAHLMPEYFGLSDTREEDEPDFMAPNQFAGQTGPNGFVEPATYPKLCFEGRQRLLKGLFIYEASRMKDRKALRRLSTEVDIRKNTQQVKEITIASSLAKPRRSPKKKTGLPLKSRNIVVLLYEEDAQVVRRGERVLMNNDKNKLSLAKIRDLAEELMTQHGLAWEEYHIQYNGIDDGEENRYEVDNQAQLNVAVLMDEEVGRVKHQFVFVEGEPERSVRDQAWPTHLSDI